MVYDVTNPQSFSDIESYWLNEVDSYAEKNVALMLMGNKKDLEEEVEEEKVNTLANSRGILRGKTSAKTGEKVEEAFTDIT